jgi:uncharacterized metal-binding protein YceD (DUF177 family)
MELPLVPMHERCPQTPAALQGQVSQSGEAAPERPHPFAALQKLKGRE